MADLMATRDMLLPGVWAIANEYDTMLDVVVDLFRDCISIRSLRDGELMKVTRAEIEDGTFKTTFRPSLISAIEARKA